MTTPTGNTGFISEMDVRVWMRDHDPAANLLIKDYEFGEEELRTAATLTIDAWNEEPPNLAGANYTLYNFPYRYNMLMGVAAQLLRIAANLFRRNSLAVSVPGGAIDDQAKHVAYDAAADKIWMTYIGWVQRKKRELNMTRGWGTV